MIINVHGGHSLVCRGASALLDEVVEDRNVKNRVIQLLRQHRKRTYRILSENVTLIALTWMFLYI